MDKRTGSTKGKEKKDGRRIGDSGKVSQNEEP